MLVFGSSSGELPELSAYDITSGSYSGSWTALTPTLATPEVEVINTVTTTEAGTDFAIDREQLDLDCAFGVLP